MGKFFFVQIKNKIAVEERLVGFKYSNKKIDSFFIHSLLGSPMSFPFLTQFIE